MSILQIPVDSTQAAFEQTMVLDGINYLLRIYWNTRDESWYLDLFATNETSIICGLKLVVNYDFIGFYVQTDVPPGMFILYDDTNSEIPCGRNDLGNRCILLYITIDDEFFQ